MAHRQLGEKFNVERSTVSKILRDKEKYLANPVLPVETVGTIDPGEEIRPELLKVEKTLARWVRKQGGRMPPITDDDLCQQARKFAVGCQQSRQDFTPTPAWLEQFKREYTDVEGGEAPKNGQDELDRLDSDPMPPTSGASQSISSEEEDKLSRLRMWETSPPILDLDDNSGGAIWNDVDFQPPSSDLEKYYAVDRDPTSHIVSSPSAEQHTIFVDPRCIMRHPSSVSGSVLLSNDQAVDAVSHASLPPPLQSSLWPPSLDVALLGGEGESIGHEQAIQALYTIRDRLEQRPDVAEPGDYVIIGRLMEKLRTLGRSGSTIARTRHEPEEQ